MKLNYTQRCLICNKDCENLPSHIKAHKISVKTYYDTYLRKPDEGYCKTCKGPIKFHGLNNGYSGIYCSNYCHGQDKEATEAMTKTLRNRSKKAKALTRKKQIKTWTKNMGPNWASVMAQRACDSYDEKNGTSGGPFSSKEVRKKCEESWNGATSPACNKETQEKISKSISALMRDDKFLKTNFYDKTLKSAQTIDKNITSYNGVEFTYKCPDCNNVTTFSNQFFHKRIERNIKLCSICVPKSGISVPEKELLTYISTIYNDVIIENDKEILNGREIDILLPHKKLAFEFDGVYWHMDERFHSPDELNVHKQKTAQEIWDYDKQKDLDCLGKNIKLIHIKEYDWNNDKENVKEMIKNMISEVN